MFQTRLSRGLFEANPTGRDDQEALIREEAEHQAADQGVESVKSVSPDINRKTSLSPRARRGAKGGGRRKIIMW